MKQLVLWTNVWVFNSNAVTKTHCIRLRDGREKKQQHLLSDANYIFNLFCMKKAFSHWYKLNVVICYVLQTLFIAIWRWLFTAKKVDNFFTLINFVYLARRKKNAHKKVFFGASMFNRNSLKTQQICLKEYSLPCHLKTQRNSSSKVNQNIKDNNNRSIHRFGRVITHMQEHQNLWKMCEKREKKTKIKCLSSF